MKKYHYKDTKVIEKSTSFIIKNCKTKNEAKKLTGKLNGGSGLRLGIEGAYSVAGNPHLGVKLSLRL
jgi:uncharacterized lipoprotein YehR (DUF1307 family)